MGGRSSKLRWLGCFLLLVASCRSTTPDLKPPKGPEDFRLPPSSDDRFNRPVDYPRYKFEEDPLKAKLLDEGTPLNPGPAGPGKLGGHP